MVTLPLLMAALAAGLLGGVHCIAMCGALGSWLGTAARRRVIPIVATAPAMPAASNLSAWLALAYLHAGRMTTYALLGALAGASGGVGLLLQPFLPLRAVFMLVGNVALVLLGWRLLGLPLPAWPWHQARWWRQLLTRLPRPGQYHPWLNGLAWGCMPCGLLYAVLPFALLSGAAWSGALLLLLFGLGTLPWLLLAQTAAVTALRRVRPLLAGLMLLWGALGVWAWLSGSAIMPGWLDWCATS
ncbi:MAG: hypothetical protein RL748_4575 [Pseudomonadota bacterium]|jgi:sulfite exporter TauE/SafE